MIHLLYVFCKHNVVVHCKWNKTYKNYCIAYFGININFGAYNNIYSGNFFQNARCLFWDRYSSDFWRNLHHMPSFDMHTMSNTDRPLSVDFSSRCLPRCPFVWSNVISLSVFFSFAPYTHLIFDGFCCENGLLFQHNNLCCYLKYSFK
jgi:hypothetical protein